MQNRYVGDLGDFGKYGLLNGLCCPDRMSQHATSWPMLYASEMEPADRQSLTLGVTWYLVPDESHNGDGKYVQYLEPSAHNQEYYRACDPLLYDELSAIINADKRSVCSIRDSQSLPPGTQYFEGALTFEGIQSLLHRMNHRCDWLQQGLDATAGCDVVFVDPDNGIAGQVSPCQSRGPKYVFYDDLLPYVRRNQSLVVYHHIGRQGSARKQIQDKMNEIQMRLGCEAFALLYHRGSARVFFVIPISEHWDMLLSRATHFITSPWSRHFELLQGPL